MGVRVGPSVRSLVKLELNFSLHFANKVMTNKHQEHETQANIRTAKVQAGPGNIFE